MANEAYGPTPYNLGFANLTPFNIAEDVYPEIQNIDPSDTPGLTSFPKTTAKSNKHEWLTDTLPAAVTGGAVWGADFSYGSYGSTWAARTRLHNYTQIFRRDVVVPGTVTEMDDVIGVDNEYALQSLKEQKAINKGIETVIFGNITAVTGNAFTGAVMYGIRTLAARGAGYAVPSAKAANGAGGAITVADINGMCEALALLGAKPDTLFSSLGVKADITQAVMWAAPNAASAITNFTPQSNQRTQPLDRGVQNIRFFEGDYAILALVPDLFIAQSSLTADNNAAFICERSRIRVAIGRPVRPRPLPPGGDNVRGMVLGELTLELLHPSAVGILTNITT